MITLTRLGGLTVRVDTRQIETVESEHETRLHLLTGLPLVVREDAEAVVDAVAESRRRRVYGLPTNKGRTGLS